MIAESMPLTWITPVTVPFEYLGDWEMCVCCVARTWPMLEIGPNATLSHAAQTNVEDSTFPFMYNLFVPRTFWKP